MTTLYKSVAAVAFVLCLAFAFSVGTANGMGSNKKTEKEMMEQMMNRFIGSKIP